jgi:cell division transport system ATP-binding protein
VIAFEQVAYSYGGVATLSDVNVHIAKGSFHFLTGLSGSGKSTFLKLCYADLVPSAGRVSVFGEYTNTLISDDLPKIRRRIGVVHQDCQFIEHLSVVDNVILPLTVSQRAALPQDVADLLNWVGLSSVVGMTPMALSGGERQRVALARAVINSPEMILADEPTGNVDWEMSLRLLTLLVEMNKMGKTIVVATHDLNLIRTAKALVASRVLRIKDGRVLLAGADL